MTPLFKRHLFFAIATVALLAGCSGGESGTGATANNQTTQGVVTGFGSVFVNGVEYSTTQASVSIDGIAKTEADLAVGMVVTIDGSVDSNGVTGTAKTISSKTEVEGLVLQNNIGGDGTINVMGQTVHISNDTRFKPGTSGITSIDLLIAGTHVVEVSGFSNSQGVIYATYVKVVDSSGSAAEVKLHGTITLFAGNATGGSFSIGNMNVSYDGLTQFEGGITAGDLMDGLTVSVESANYTGTGSVMATKIELENLSSEAEGTNLELEGVVTDDSLVLSSQFELNGRVIHFDVLTTSFEGGNATDILKDVTLEVEGQAQADGSVLASAISFREESDMRINGTVTAVVNNTLTVSNATETRIITVNELTSYEDETNMNNQYFHFNDIMSGMNVDVKYYSDSVSGVFIATSVEKVM